MLHENRDIMFDNRLGNIMKDKALTYISGNSTATEADGGFRSAGYENSWLYGVQVFVVVRS